MDNGPPAPVGLFPSTRKPLVQPLEASRTPGCPCSLLIRREGPKNADCTPLPGSYGFPHFSVVLAVRSTMRPQLCDVPLSP